MRVIGVGGRDRVMENYYSCLELSMKVISKRA